MYRKGNGTFSSIQFTGCNINGAVGKGAIISSNGDTIKHLEVGKTGQILTSNHDRDIGMSWEDTDIDHHVSNHIEKLDTYLYNYELNHLESTTLLSNTDFVNGTYRIKESGVYKLSESIVFNPNPGNDHKPTQEQIDSGQYPIAPYGPYHMGFFAAISIETDHVVLDLNGFRIDQHVSHQLQQRFYSAIELGSSPFVPKQGPSNFGDSVSYPSYVIIKNGVLGLSSHQGIHGNNASNIIIQDLEITDFEQAGWALNGCSFVSMKRIHVHSNIAPPVAASYSQARFLLPFLNSILAKPGGSDLDMVIREETKNGDSIRKELVDAMTHVHDIVSGEKDGEIEDMVSAGLFKNTGLKLDGNVYGGVFHAAGVSVNEFLLSRESLPGDTNHTILLDHVKIEKITSTPREVIGLQTPPSSSGSVSYGLGVQKGPVGDTFDILSVTGPDNTYLPNVLSNAQLFISKHGSGGSQRGGTTIQPEIVVWASTTEPTETIVDTDNYKTTCGGDSMAHVMKGNIGLFLSGTTRVVCNQLCISDVSNLGKSGTSDPECYHHTGLLNDHIGYQGNNTRGIALVSSEHCYFRDIHVKKIDSITGYALPIDYIGENKTIVVHNHSST